MYVKVYNDMTDSEKRQILRLLQRLNAKRRRDQKPRLEYVVDFRNQDCKTSEIKSRKELLDKLINTNFTGDEIKTEIIYPKKVDHTR